MRPVKWRRSAMLLAALAAAGCADLPRDPERTLRRVEGGRLRVGLVDCPPWVVRAAGEPGGVEVELVRGLAAELGATPVWAWGGEQQHLEALEHFELDLVLAGVTRDTPWRDRVGLTASYFDERAVVGGREKTRGHALAVPPGENGWLRRVDDYLHRRGGDIPGLLDREANRR